MLQRLKSEIMVTHKTLAVILGSIITVVIVAQFKWMHNSGNYQNLWVKMMIALIAGVIIGLLYFYVLSFFVKTMSRKLISFDNGKFLNQLMFIHLPLYLLWIYPFHIQWNGQFINKYLLVVVFLLMVFQILIWATIYLAKLLNKNVIQIVGIVMIFMVILMISILHWKVNFLSYNYSADIGFRLIGILLVGLIIRLLKSAENKPENDITLLVKENKAWNFDISFIILAMIIFSGFLLRVVGADWGFPFLLHPDEPVIANIPFDMAKRASLDPNIFNRPNHISIYINAIVHHLASFIKFGRPLIDTFSSHMSFYYLISRLTVAVLGTIMIFVAYLIGKEYNKKFGIIAAALFAVFPSFIIQSHYITPDIPVTLFMMLVILFTIQYLKNPTGNRLILMSLFTALSVGEKYPSLLVVFVIMAVIIWTHRNDIPKLILHGLISALLFASFLFLFTPYLYFEWPKVIGCLITEARNNHPGADGLGYFGNLMFYAIKYFDDTQYILLLFMIVGIVFLIKDHKKYSIPVFFGFVYWILLSRLALHFDRWAVPMFVGALMATGYGIYVLHNKIVKNNGLIRVIFYFCFIIIVTLGFMSLLSISLKNVAMLTFKDTRYIAAQFCKRNGINGTNSIYEGYTPLSPGGWYNFGEISDWKIRKDPKLKYIILSSYMYDRFIYDKERYKIPNEFYQKVFSFPLVKDFYPNYFWAASKGSFFLPEVNEITYDMKFLNFYFQNKSGCVNGPTIKIYKITSYIF